jgi:phosphoglycerate dehydrogenase-like enzyme
MRVVITDPNLLPLRSELESLLPEGTDVAWATPDTVLEALHNADVLVGPAFTQEMADAAPNTYHHEDAIAELRREQWRSPVYDAALPQPHTLASSSIGFFGLGHIGRAAWRVLRAFGAHGQAVTGSGRTDAEGLNWAGDTSQLPRLLDESDAVVVSAPLTDSTRGLIGTAELQRLGPDGVLVNVARGPLVQEQALYDALRARTIRGAALDVWYSYPGPDGRGKPADAPFGELDNVLLTPHVSGITRQTFLGRVQDIAANL